MKKQPLIICIFLLGLWFIIGLSSAIVSAQVATEWNPLQRVPEYQDDSLPPYLIADQNKTIHAFANQLIGEDSPQAAIVYRQWTLTRGWTSPVDILLSNVGESQLLGTFLDQTGMMHMIYWRGGDQGANIYHTMAPATRAGQAQAWSAPELVGENASIPGSAAIAGDDSGNLVIIYYGVRDGNGVYAVHSSDAGLSWSESTPIFLTLSPILIPFSLQMTMGREGQIHTAWNVVDSTGVDISLYYASLDVNRQQWRDPILLDERIEGEEFFGPSFPSIVDNGDSVVIMYNSGKTSTSGEVNVGRPVQRVRLSSDGGDTWKEPIEPFPNHQGRSGSHALVVDSDGIVHALFIQRIDQYINDQYAPVGGIWHSELREGRWTEPDLFDLGEVSGHDLRAIVSQGNVLLLTMREDPGVGQVGVLYSYTTLDAPELPLVPLPSSPSSPAATPSPVAAQVVAASTPFPELVAGDQGNGRTGISGDPTRLLLFGLAPVILVLAGTVIVRQYAQYRRR
jgi:hypothetical protein